MNNNIKVSDNMKSSDLIIKNNNNIKSSLNIIKKI